MFLTALLVGLLAAVALVLHVIEFERARRCRAGGGYWGGENCVAKRDACFVDGLRMPVGTVFGNGCNTCECGPYFTKCTAVWCLKELDGSDPSCRFPIFEPGCDAPRSRCGRGGTALRERAYCGCDGVTFKEAAPSRPYRHLGPCP